MTLFNAADGPPRQLSLVKLSAEIARSLATVGRVSVEGEVHKPTKRPSGGVYFTLRDRVAQVQVWCPPARAARCRAVNGERVQATGVLKYDNEWGRVQFVADEVVPVGAGAVAAAVADARRRLGADGLLDRPRRAVPMLPRLIGVVCGSEAAVRGDIESVIAARFPGYPVEFAEVQVSGAGASESVIAALVAFDARADVDVIILARGGGDATQLLTFSDEALCRAIAAASTVVVSAIGHEGDRPLCDEVADLRCGTPSMAAAAVVPDRADLHRELERWAERLGAAVTRRIDAAFRQLAAVDRDRALDDGLRVAADRLARAGSRLAFVQPARRLGESRATLAGLRRQLDALDPVRVLERGYAVVRLGDGAVVRSSGQLVAGASLDVQLAAGGATVTVEGIR